MPLVNNSLEGGHPPTHSQAHTHGHTHTHREKYKYIQTHTHTYTQHTHTHTPGVIITVGRQLKSAQNLRLLINPGSVWPSSRSEYSVNHGQ